MEQFEDMKIKDLRKLTEQYKKLEKENKFLKAKYPKGKLELDDVKNEDDVQKMIDQLPQ